MAKKRFRRVLLFSSAIWAFLAVAGIYSIYLARGTPQWYEQRNLTSEQQETAGNQSDQTVAEFVSYCNDLAAAERRHARTGEVMSIRPKTITLTEGQINAFVGKWEQSLVEEGVGLDQILTGERVAFLDGQVLLAGTIRNEGVLSNTVLSADIGLSLDDSGRLRPSVIQFYDGRLPLPRTLLASPEGQMRTRLERNIAVWKERSHTWRDGLSDDNAAAAAWGTILLAALDNRPVDSILVFPCNLGGLNCSVRMRVIELRVGPEQIKFTVRPLGDGETVSR